MDRTITFRHRVDGVLTNATTVVLSDPTATFGVKRNDNDAVVVADNTAMTNVSTGVYQYTFTEPAAGLSYTSYVEWVYNSVTHRAENQIPALTAPAGAMTIATARGYLEQFARTPSGDTSVYSAVDKDRAIIAACDDFFHETKYFRKKETVVMDVDDGGVQVLMPGGCLPQYILGVEFLDDLLQASPGAWANYQGVPLKMPPWEEFVSELKASAKPSEPTKIAFPGTFTQTSGVNYYHGIVNAELDTDGDYDWSFAVRWTPPLIASATWTLGSSAGSVTGATLNWPEEILRPIIIYGATSMLQHHEPEMLYKNESYKKYLDFRTTMKLAGKTKIKAASKSMLLES